MPGNELWPFGTRVVNYFVGKWGGVRILNPHYSHHIILRQQAPLASAKFTIRSYKQMPSVVVSTCVHSPRLQTKKQSKVRAKRASSVDTELLCVILLPLRKSPWPVTAASLQLHTHTHTQIFLIHPFGLYLNTAFGIHCTNTGHTWDSQFNFTGTKPIAFNSKYLHFSVLEFG
jgi:hypothetical protein